MPKRKYISCYAKCYNGITIHYDDFLGHTDKTVVFLPGMTSNAVSFFTIIDDLGDDYRCISVDLRGRGLSEHAPEGSYGIPTHAKDIIILLDTLGLKNVTLVGHSFGTNVATAVAVERPDLVKNMILIEGGKTSISMEDLEKTCEAGLQRTKVIYPSLDAYREFWRKSAPYMDDKAWTPYFDEFIKSDVKEVGDGKVQCRAMGEAISEDTMKGYTEYDTAEYAPKVKAPVCSVWADSPLFGDKPLFSEQALKELCDLLGGYTKFVRMRGANHLDVIYTPEYAQKIADEIVLAS